jgi:hypothetical protein
MQLGLVGLVVLGFLGVGVALGQKKTGAAAFLGGVGVGALWLLGRSWA